MNLADEFADMFAAQAEQIRATHGTEAHAQVRAEAQRSTAADALGRLFEQLPESAEPTADTTQPPADNDLLRRMIEGDRA